MKTLSKILIAPFFVLAFLMFSCSSDDDVEVQVNCGPDYCIADLQGTWIATEFVFSDCFGEFPSIDVIAEGASMQMVVQSNGRFTMTLSFPGIDPEVLTGRIYFEEFEGDTYFTILFDDEPNDPVSLGDILSDNNTVLQLTGGPDSAEWDFDDDGEDDCAQIFLRLEKE